MPEEKLVTFHIDVLPTDESLEQEQLDEFSRDLYQELKDSKAEDVKLASKGAVPRGAKGVEGAVAEIAVAFIAPFAPEIFKVITHWIRRGPERKVQLTSSASGKEVKVVISSEDLKTEDVDKIVDSLLASFG